MPYIRPTPNPSGAYPNTQSNPAPGLVCISDGLAAQLLAYNGFAELTIEEGRRHRRQPRPGGLGGVEGQSAA